MQKNKFISFIDGWFYPLIFLGLFLVFCAFCYANFPSADDYTQSLVINYYGRLDVMKYWYFNWTGRYVCNAFTTYTQPMSYNSLLLYKIFPLMVVSLLIFSVYGFINHFFKSVRLKLKLGITCFIFLIFYDQMPSVKDGFFWYSATWYVTGCSLVLLFWVSLDRAIEHKTALSRIIAVFYGFLCVGHIEMFLMGSIFILFVYILNHYIVYKKISKQLSVLFFLLIILACLNLFAPGNFLRSDAFQDLNQVDNMAVLTNNPVFSLKMSLKYLFKDFIEKILLSPVIVLSAVLSLLFLLPNIKFGNLRIHPIILIMLSFCFFVAIYFVLYFGTGLDAPPPLRMHNAILFFLAVAFIFLINYSFSWYKIKILQQNNLKLSYLLHALIFILFLALDNNIHKSLKSFRARDYLAYKEEIDQRMNLVRSHPNDTLIVDSLNFFPKMIFNFDITAKFNDPLHNQSFAKYWGLKAIRLKGDTSLIRQKK